MNAEEKFLFDLDAYPISEPAKSIRPIDVPLWTRNKALFIARYLKTFTYVTKHGTYIDAFAGPQHDTSRDKTWAVRLVMENEPAWLRNFLLFELNKDSVAKLEELKLKYLERHPISPKRTVSVVPGDCNINLPRVLEANPLRENEAAFCLLDQRSTECDWQTVEFISNHKGKARGHKIEVFYFLAQGWIDRAIRSWKHKAEDRCFRWWGRSDVLKFLQLSSYERGRAMAERFKDELGYRFAYPFPIQQDGCQGRIMFWMIHATDHERAPELMLQAYRHIGAGGGLNEPYEQLEFSVERLECDE